MNSIEEQNYCMYLSDVFQDGLSKNLMNQTARIFQGDQIVYNMGDEAHSIFYLRRGLVKINTLSDAGKELILTLHKPGEIFGEFCFCEDHRNEMAVTMEPSEIVEIKLKEILNHFETNQGTLLNLLISVTKRLARSYQILREHSFDPLPERLAKALLRLADEMGQETARGMVLTYHITQEELAQMVSARREVVSSELSRMRERGYIAYDRGGKFTIHRLALMAYIEGGADCADEILGRREQPLMDHLRQQTHWSALGPIVSLCSLL
jgi:CRP/FNR family cyclic AMP-dependent transcriptional regulator